MMMLYILVVVLVEIDPCRDRLHFKLKSEVQVQVAEFKTLQLRSSHLQNLKFASA